jgi:hypothetical protein
MASKWLPVNTREAQINRQDAKYDMADSQCSLRT